MKKYVLPNLLKISVALLLMGVILFSCQKDQYIQKFDDVFDLSGVNELNMKIENASSISDLTGEFTNVNITVPEGLQHVDLNQIIEEYKSNIKLSSTEVDMLLKNDSKTYIDVINRFGSLPAQIKDLNLNFEEVKSSPLNKYLVRQKVQTDNFYSDDYYSAILAYRNFIESEIIQPMENLNRAMNLKSAGNSQTVTEEEVYPYYVLITSNNNWDMWWAYWNDGTRTKHKGSSGDFPG